MLPLGERDASVVRKRQKSSAIIAALGAICGLRVFAPARRGADAQGTALNPAMRAGVRCGSPAPLKQSKAPGIHRKHARLACRRTAPYARSASGKPISPKKLFHASSEPDGRRAADAQGTALNPAMRAGVRCGPPAPLKHFSAPGIHRKHVRLACRRTAPYARSASGTVCPLGVREAHIAKKLFHASPCQKSRVRTGSGETPGGPVNRRSIAPTPPSGRSAPGTTRSRSRRCVFRRRTTPCSRRGPCSP